MPSRIRAIMAVSKACYGDDEKQIRPTRQKRPKAEVRIWKGISRLVAAGAVYR